MRINYLFYQCESDSFVSGTLNIITHRMEGSSIKIAILKHFHDF